MVFSVLLATTNQGKIKEISHFFRGKISFLTLFDFPDLKSLIPPEETADTFSGNALIKARFFATKTNLPVLAEDSGFTMSAFPGKFGVKTRRAFIAKNDMDWMTQFLSLLDGVSNRKAEFSSALAFIEKGTEKTFNSSVQGIITEFPQTPLEKGVPVSAVFIPKGSDLVFSAMGKTEKNKASHRGKTLQKFGDWLSEKI